MATCCYVCPLAKTEIKLKDIVRLVRFLSEFVNLYFGLTRLEFRRINFITFSSLTINKIITENGTLIKKTLHAMTLVMNVERKMTELSTFLIHAFGQSAFCMQNFPDSDITSLGHFHLRVPRYNNTKYFETLRLLSIALVATNSDDSIRVTLIKSVVIKAEYNISREELYGCT
ncbi:hypothetical protein CHS0354_024878 [Potamilus streckersoni]|uniref:Uncharacterized protein n=1 Tax=Potamilus streckersoni TaxID=2493646 RepID=A0AAE0TFC3_9BIVA|nr:hypothetical protein CHS0354_024878 [Potamilus streckersoni]